jgi:hypothetical protein
MRRFTEQHRCLLSHPDDVVGWEQCRCTMQLQTRAVCFYFKSTSAGLHSHGYVVMTEVTHAGLYLASWSALTPQHYTCDLTYVCICLWVVPSSQEQCSVGLHACAEACAWRQSCGWVVTTPDGTHAGRGCSHAGRLACMDSPLGVPGELQAASGLTFH